MGPLVSVGESRWGKRFVPGPQVTARETFSETRFMGIRSRRVSFLLTFSITSFDSKGFSFIYSFLSPFVRSASRRRPMTKSKAERTHP